MNGQQGPMNIKDVSRDIFDAIRSATALPNLGNNRQQFESQFLVPALCKTQVVYQGLQEDVFGTA